MTDQIALAVIPSTKLVEFQHKAHKYVVIAEEKFDINKTGSEEKEILLKQPKEFEKTIRAVVALIVKLNLSDIAPRNLPTIEPTQPGQPRRIVMIDLEEASGCAIGLWGEDENRPGLLGCVPESLVDVVFDEARKQGVQISAEEEERLRRRRLEELAKERSLEEFHTEHHIVTGSEHLDVKPEELGLDLNEKTVVDCPTDDWKAMKRIEITMKEVVEKVVKMINDIIDEKSTEKASIKAKRYFLIGTSYKQFPQRFIEAGLPPGNWIISAQEEKEAWLYRVVSALAEKKYIHSFRYDGVGRFWIQA
jgi:hypothetical protein